MEDPKNEGRKLSQVSGMVSPVDLAEIQSAQLTNGKTYKCEICGQPKVAPEVSRCLCGLIVCDACYPDHASGY